MGNHLVRDADADAESASGGGAGGDGFAAGIAETTGGLRERGGEFSADARGAGRCGAGTRAGGDDGRIFAAIFAGAGGRERENSRVRIGGAAEKLRVQEFLYGPDGSGPRDAGKPGGNGAGSVDLTRGAR